MALLYLLLKTSNPSGYRQLPSSKGKDEKLKLLKSLERNFVYSEEDKKSENLSQESLDEDTHDSDEEYLGRQKTEGQLLWSVFRELMGWHWHQTPSLQVLTYLISVSWFRNTSRGGSLQRFRDCQKRRFRCRCI